MRATWAICLAALLEWSSAPADDLSDLRSVRTLAAEAAEVVHLQTQHKITGTYAAAMKEEAREQLKEEMQKAEPPSVRKLGEPGCIGTRPQRHRRARGRRPAAVQNGRAAWAG